MEKSLSRDANRSSSPLVAVCYRTESKTFYVLLPYPYVRENNTLSLTRLWRWLRCECLQMCDSCSLYLTQTSASCPNRCEPVLGQVINVPGRELCLWMGTLWQFPWVFPSWLVFYFFLPLWLPLLRFWHPAPRVFVFITHIPHVTPSALCQRWKSKSVKASFICVITNFHFFPSLADIREPS